MKDETQAKDEIILVVKEAMADNTSARDIDDIAEIDSNDVDHIAEAVADRLYADGWRKRAREDDKADVFEYGNMLYSSLYSERENNEAQIEEMAKVIIKAGESYYKMPVDIECANREASELYDKGYRKQSDTVRDFMAKVVAQGNITYSRYEGKEYIEITMEKFNKIAAKYGVNAEDL